MIPLSTRSLLVEHGLRRCQKPDEHPGQRGMDPRFKHHDPRKKADTGNDNPWDTLHTHKE